MFPTCSKNRFFPGNGFAFLFTFIAAIFLISSTCFSDTLEELSYENRWPEFSPRNLTGSGDDLYFCSGNIFTVLDASTLTEKARLALDVKKGISSVSANPSSPFVYVGGASTGLKVIDQSDPSQPVISGELLHDAQERPIYATSIDYMDNRVYVADVFYGLRIIDVSNPANPNQSGSHEQLSEYVDEETQTSVYSGGFIGIKVKTIHSKKYAFILDKYYGLRIFDVTTDSLPLELDKYDMRTKLYYGQLSLVTDLYVDSAHAYITDLTNGLTILDIFSNSENPGLIDIAKKGQIATPGAASGISLFLDKAYIADGNEGMFVCDVRDRANPVQTGHYPATGTYSTLASEKGVFLADATNGLTRLAPGNDNQFDPNGNFPAPSQVNRLIVNGEYGYYLDSGGPDEGLRVVLYTGAGEGELAGFIKTPGEASNIKLFEDWAYIADGSAGITMVDVENKEELKLAGTFKPGGFASDLFLGQGFDGTRICYVADKKYGLVIADMDSEGGLTEISTLPLDNAQALTIVSKVDPATGLLKIYSLLATGEALVVVDVSHKDAPIIVSETPTSGPALDVTTSSKYVVLAEGNEGISLYDLSDVTAPVKLAAYDTPGGCSAVSVLNSYIHAADGDKGVLVLGITEEDGPELSLITSYDTPGVVSDVFILQGNFNYTYVADSQGGSISFKHSDRLSDGIDEKPFPDSPDDTGWDRADSSSCFISTLLR